MDFEQKYKRALGIAQRGYDIIPNEEFRKQLAEMFPELESEDERMIKAITKGIRDVVDEHGWSDFGGVPTEDILDWLKKQREKNTADKVEPKFKVGDWVVLNGNHDSIYKVEKIENYHYVLRHILGGVLTIPFGFENSMRLRAIQDAKDGDVLVNGSNIFIFLCIKAARIMGYCHTNIDDGLFYDDIGSIECFGLVDATFYPATKEQRDLLFAKMKEAGYEWDADKKELKKI